MFRRVQKGIAGVEICARPWYQPVGAAFAIAVDAVYVGTPLCFERRCTKLRDARRTAWTQDKSNRRSVLGDGYGEGACCPCAEK